jgi:protease I
MRIACILAEGYEDSEMRVPYDAFTEAGHDVKIIGVEKGKKLAGKNGKEKVKTEAAIDEVSPSDFDALFIPGGHSPDQLRADDRMVDFVKAFADKPILAICHGPQILLTAGLVSGRRVTAWKTVQVDLRHAGANVVDEEVVTDGNLVTSRMPDDLPAFVRASMEQLRAAASTHASA